MKKAWPWIVGLLAAAIAVYFAARQWGGDEAYQSVYTAKPIDLKIEVFTTGELQALNSEDIKGPDGLRQAGIYEVKISDLIPEGTVIDSGAYIATLDRTEISNKLRDLSADVDKFQSQYLQTQLDTALELRKLRDDLLNQKFGLEEKRLVLKQSQYETPATIRQAEIELERAERTYRQAQKDYKLKLQQNRAKMSEVAATLNQRQAKYDQMQQLLDRFIVKAPKGGMIIYKKDWEGRKLKVGSSITAWDPAVATLPDLSVLMSRTYVNEVDISKLKVGLPVTVTVDAVPGTVIEGKISSVANIGEQLPNTDAKVFEVIVLLGKSDSTLRPAMTTNNRISVATIPKTLAIPFEGLFGADSLQYVIRKESGKIWKQQVVTGSSSSDLIEITQGLNDGEVILLNDSGDFNQLELKRLTNTPAR